MGFDKVGNSQVRQTSQYLLADRSDKEHNSVIFCNLNVFLLSRGRIHNTFEIYIFDVRVTNI